MDERSNNQFIPMTSIASGSGTEVKSDVFYYTNQIVNIVMIGNPQEKKWILVDTGMPKSGEKILSVAKQRFGENCKPLAIILTHGHFDRIGGIIKLLEEWNVPVYAHPLEFPFLSNTKHYPEPDPSVEGGLLAKMASIYPNEPIDILNWLCPLPEDHSVPFLNEWKWIHVPGHSPGQVALFRESDRLLLSADAFVTVRQDSFYKVLIQKKEVNGPPRYFTTDWQAAWDSARQLQSLEPQIVIAGHGQIMEGEDLRHGLKKLVDEFDTMAIPSHGKYVTGNYH